MATRIVSWGGDEKVTALSPSLSKAPSIVSLDSILPEKLSTSQNSPRSDGPRAKHMTSQLTESSETRTSWTSSKYPFDTTDNSFTRHHKYFFEDGNIAFLVRDHLQLCVLLFRFTQ